MQLSFKFIPSDISNDHQTRILIDGVDVIELQNGGTHLGIDPVQFFSQPALRGIGDLLIGRCECGCTGCDDFYVSVSRSTETVEWKIYAAKGNRFIFSLREYDLAIEAGSCDATWETPGRTAERLISQLDYSMCAKEGFLFQWASARIKRNQITLCFKKGSENLYYDATWDEKTPKTAQENVKQMLEKLFGNALPTKPPDRKV